MSPHIDDLPYEIPCNLLEFLPDKQLFQCYQCDAVD